MLKIKHQKGRDKKRSRGKRETKNKKNAVSRQPKAERNDIVKKLIRKTSARTRIKRMKNEQTMGLVAKKRSDSHLFSASESSAWQVPFHPTTKGNHTKT